MSPKGRVDINVLERGQVDRIPVPGGFQLGPLMRPRKRKTHPLGLHQLQRFLGAKDPLEYQRSPRGKCPTQYHGEVPGPEESVRRPTADRIIQPLLISHAPKLDGDAAV